MVNKLIAICVNTGLVTTIAYILAIITASGSSAELTARIVNYASQLAALPSTNLTYAFPDYMISPLYCNSVLANLNSRHYVRGRTVIGDTKLEPIEFHIGKPVSPTYFQYCAIMRVLIAMKVSETRNSVNNNWTGRDISFSEYNNNGSLGRFRSRLISDY